MKFYDSLPVSVDSMAYEVLCLLNMEEGDIKNIELVRMANKLAEADDMESGTAPDAQIYLLGWLDACETINKKLRENEERDRDLYLKNDAFR